MPWVCSFIGSMVLPLSQELHLLFLAWAQPQKAPGGSCVFSRAIGSPKGANWKKDDSLIFVSFMKICASVNSFGKIKSPLPSPYSITGT